MRRAVPWLTLLAAYVAAAFLLTPNDPAAQIAPLIQRLSDHTSAEVTNAILAVPAALAFAVAAALARFWVPDPWATRGVLAAAVSPLGFALSSSGRPDAVAAALLTGGLLLAMQARQLPTRANVMGSAACFAFAPWFGVPFFAASGVGLVVLVVGTAREGRPLLAFLAVELMAATIVAVAGVDQPLGHAATPGHGPIRLLAVLFDHHVGVLRWAPVLALAFAGAFLLVRSRREQLARVIPARRDAEVGAAITGLVIVAVWIGAAFGRVGPGAAVPLTAALGTWGLRRWPRIGALLALATLALTVWSGIALATGDSAGWLDAG